MWLWPWSRTGFMIQFCHRANRQNLSFLISKLSHDPPDLSKFSDVKSYIHMCLFLPRHPSFSSSFNIFHPYHEGKATDFMDSNDSYQLRSQMDRAHIYCFSSPSSIIPRLTHVSTHKQLPALHQKAKHLSLPQWAWLTDVSTPQPAT